MIVLFKDLYGFTPLHYVSDFTSNKKRISIPNDFALNVTKSLLENPTIDVNFTNSSQYSPLHCAIENFHSDIAKLLLNHPNINANLKDLSSLCYFNLRWYNCNAFSC